MKKISILILTLLVAMAACKKVPEVNKEYVDVERDLITVGTTTATIQCDYEYITTLKKAYLYYGEGEDATDMNVTEMSVVQKTLYVELGGLKGNTTYSYYYEFVNGFNSMKSAVKTFKTEASPTEVTLPTVMTAEVTEITANSAKGGGEVTNDGGTEVTERGICWSTSENPTLNDNHIASGTGVGAFTALLSGLEANATYHVRAYATNEKGTAYGLDREFVTVGGGSGAPEGAINGLFTINENGDQVYFSQGNLQYSKSTQTWSFMAHQYDIVEVEGQNVGVDYANQDIVSLFGWGTSGYDHGAIAFQPWSTSSSYGDYYAYGDWDYNLFDQTGMADWGYNAIVNGGNIENSGWRTLTCAEWDYVINIRNTKSGCRYAKAKVNGVNGIILLPYDWITSIYALNNTNGGTYNSNTISAEVWTNTLEANGAVFLPAAGLRNGSGFSFVESYGNYWSSSGLTGSNGAFGLYFGSDDLGVSGYDGTSGRSVRLVRDATSHPSNTTPTVITSNVSNVTSNSASCGGEVTNDGGTTVTERGLCWSTNANPTLTDNHVAAGTGTGTFTAAVSGLQTNTTYHVRAYATNEAGTAYGQDIEFTTLQGGGSGEHEYVDLGLPSGTLWATCNVGANAPEEYGDYFAWGEVEPKDMYGWRTYKYCNGDVTQLTKYTTSAYPGYNGIADNLTLLQPTDDAATVNWGNDWCMPTYEQWCELCGTTHTWTSLNGTLGMLFTADNGNSLFLPAAGYRRGGELIYAGSYGIYWSNSLFTGGPIFAWNCYFYSDYPDQMYVDTRSRDSGRSVRPVRSAPQN